MSANINPIAASVIRHRLTAIVQEMGEAMLRTSYSQFLNSSRDFSFADLWFHGGKALADERVRAPCGYFRCNMVDEKGQLLLPNHR